MARHRGIIRRNLTRNRSIALGIAIFAFLIVGFGIVDIGVNLFQGGAFVEGTQFSVQIIDNIIPLELLDNYAVQCSLWTEGEIVATDGSRRPIGFDTFGPFRPQFTIDVFDPTTSKELDRVIADIKLRCDSTTYSSADQFVLKGGNINYIWSVENRGTGQLDNIGRPTSVSLSPSSNVLQPPSGGGIKLAGTTILASTIDSATVSSVPEYLVELRLIISGNLIFEQRIDPNVQDFDQQTKSFSLTSQIGSQVGEFLRVSNEIVDPPPPTSNIVDITLTDTIPRPLFKSDLSPEVRICVNVPLYDSTKETRPRVDLFRPSSDGSGTLTKFISNSVLQGVSSGETFCTTIDLSSSQLFVGNYKVVANMATRTGTDSSVFTVFADDQEMIIIEPSPCKDLTGAALLGCAAENVVDPCEGLTGATLDQCRGIEEQFNSCSDGFEEVSRETFLLIQAGIGTIPVIIQSGFKTTDDPICLAKETLGVFSALATAGSTTTDICANLSDEECEALLTGGTITTPTTTTGITCSTGNVAIGNTCVKSCKDLTDAECSTEIARCSVTTGLSIPECSTILKATQTGTETATIITSLDEIAKLSTSVILYQIAYDGANERGSIISPTQSSISFTNSLLELAGIPTGKGALWELKRILVVPAIDITDTVPFIEVRDSNPQFKYTWTAEVLKLDGTKRQATIEVCNNSCRIFTMPLIALQVQSNTIGVQTEDNTEKTYYQIARSDIQPDEIRKGLESAFALGTGTLDTFLGEGDQVTLKVKVEGGFKPAITFGGVTQTVQAVISPMEWSHTFTWIPQFGADQEPCAALSGQPQLDCLGNPVAKSDACKDLTANECNKELPATDENGCAVTLVGTSSENQEKLTLCYGLMNDETIKTSTFGGTDDKSDVTGDNKDSTLGICADGTSASVCLELKVKEFQESLSGILGTIGLTSSNIAFIENNATTIVIAIIALIILGVIGRAAYRRRRRRF